MGNNRALFYQHHGLLMDEQMVNEHNPLFSLVIDKHTTQVHT
jgi:hypothetical protein